MGSSTAASSPRLLAGRYRLGPTIGTGATAKVFDAVDITDSTPVVVKMLPAAFGRSQGFMRRFETDVQAAAELSHPNIARVRDFGVERVDDRSFPFVVTEQLAGGSLRGLLDRGRHLTPSQALVVGLDVCRGLDYAHKRGLVHGAITPSNLLFGMDRKVRIADFGLSRLLGEVAWADLDRVDVDVARYASPEHAAGAPIVPVSDVYTLCIGLIESVTGQVPFAADTAVATLMARVDKLMPVSADLGPLAAVLERAGRPLTADRATAAEFGKALVQAAEKMPRPAPIPIVGIGMFGDVTGSLPRLTEPIGDLTATLSRPAEPVTPTGRPENGVAAGGEPSPVIRPTVRIIATSDPVAPPGEDPLMDVERRPLRTGPSPAQRHEPPARQEPSRIFVPNVPPPIEEPAALRTPIVEPRSGVTVRRPVPAEDHPLTTEGHTPTTEGRPTTPEAPSARSEPPSARSEPPSPLPPPDPADIGLPPIVPAEPVDPSGPVIRLADPVDEPSPTIVTDPPTGAPPAPTQVFDVQPLVDHDEPDELAGDDLDELIDEISVPIDPTIGVATTWATAEAPARRPTAIVETVEGDDDAPNIDRRSMYAYVLVALGLMIAAVVGLIGYRALSTPSYAVPNLIGASEAEATNQVAANGWTIEVRRERNDSQAQGDVIRTEPSAGEKLKKGSNFVMVVSEGATLATLPEIAGLPVDEARTMLVEAGLSVREADRAFDEIVEAGRVISWSVPAQAGLAAGGQVPKGTTIEVVVSAGPSPRQVPNLVGATVSEANEQLVEDDLVLGTITQEFNDQVPAGQIISTNPTAGMSATRDTRIDIVVSKGPDLVAVPNLLGKTKAEMEAALIQVGLLVGSTTGPVDGVVAGTDIAAGTRVARGTKISVIFGTA